MPKSQTMNGKKQMNALSRMPAPKDGQSSASGNPLSVAGQVANSYATADVFRVYISLKSPHTVRAQLADLDTFASFLGSIGLHPQQRPSPQELQTSPAAWAGITWGLVEGFVRWMLNQGYAIGSVNRKLATLRTYAKLAAQAGVVDLAELGRIQQVRSYSRKEGQRIDRKRDINRVGAKKAQNTVLTVDQAARLKQVPADSLMGCRDGLIICLLLDHGLRVGEVAGLQVTDINLDSATFTFYRSKVDMVQTHRMTPDTLLAAERWLADIEFPTEGPLIRAILKGGKVANRGITVRAIAALVKRYGKSIGIPQLSPHDCRHYWATRAVAQGTDTFALRDAGGWKSIAMPSRYVEASRIANERVKL